MKSRIVKSKQNLTTNHIITVNKDQMSDREQLISMGFDPARVDCKLSYQNSELEYSRSSIYAGALKATQNRGLQPAIDHLVEHESQSIPDGGPGATKSSGAEVISVDDDEEEALKAALDLSKGIEPNANSGEAAAGGEAKVSAIKDIQICFSIYRNQNSLSSVCNVARSLRIPLLSTSTQRSLGMINLKSPQRRQGSLFVEICLN
jgi:hypothetical protein